MSLFFNLLPTDLQVHVLHGWVNEKDNGHQLLRVLSAMDVACSMSQQECFRQLITQLPAFGEFCSHPDDELLTSTTKVPKPTRFATNYLQWLGSRKVPVKSIVLTRNTVYGVEQLNKSKLRLPSVESIVWTGNDYLTGELVEAVMRACPNITHLELGRSIAFSPDMAQHVPKLRSIKIGGSYHSRSDKKMASVMVFGPQLRELRIGRCKFDEALFIIMSSKALGLQALEIEVGKGVSHQFVQLLQMCKDLRELVLHSNYSDALDADTLSKIAASPQLKKLTVNTYADAHIACAMFTAVLEQRPDLEHLQVGEWKLVSAEGVVHVHLSTDEHVSAAESAALTTTLSACPAAKELKALGTIDKDVAEIIVRNVKGPLQSLSAMVTDSVPLEILLRKFGMTLKHLDISSEGLTDDMLRFIAAQCPQLESIVFNDARDAAATDEGIASFLAACPRIRKVCVQSMRTITVETLQAILTRKVRLQQLYLTYCGIDTKVDWYRQQAKELQLLPVPAALQFS